MNPANFPQAMMAGQPMPQGGNLSNQIKATLFARFQQQQNVNGWQSSLQPAERVNLVMQLTTSLSLAQPNMGQDNALKGALAFEAEKFTRSSGKDQYLAMMRQQLQMLQQKRMQQSQNANMGQMGNMPGMMGQPMQNNMSNQGNPMAQQFNAQLGRPMQVSQLPMNGGQTPQGMQMGGMPNQNQGMQNNPQQQGGNAGAMSMEQQNINRIAQRLLQQASDEDKQRIMSQFSGLPPQHQAQLRQRLGDPIIAHYRRMAQQLYNKQMGNKMPNQGAQNGMPNNHMGQQTPMMGQPQQQMQMNGQQPDGAIDFSQFMTQMQQEAIRSQDSGQLVVPASNNAAMMGQNLNSMPIGLNGQMGAPNMNNANQMQNIMQQQRQQGGLTQQQAAARLQAQMRSQQQNGQPNQQGQMNAQMKMGTQSPMPQQRQPGMQQPGQQQPGATPQQQRPTPAPTPQMAQGQPSLNPQMIQMMQQAGMNGQQKPIRRPLPNGLPPNTPQNVRDFLQTCDDDHYRVAIEQLRKQMGGNQMPGQGPNPMQANQMGQQPGQQQNPMLNNGQPGQMNQAQLNQLRMAAAQQRANQTQAQGQGRPGAGQMQLVPEIIQKMDGQQFPRSILHANNAQMVPSNVMTFAQLKEFIINNPAMAGQLTPMKLGGFQMDMFRRMQSSGQLGGNVGQMGGQMNAGQPGGAPNQAPTANMVPPQGANNNAMGQQQPQGGPPQQNLINAQLMSQLQNMTVAPQEILQARQKNMFPPQMSDDEIRTKIVNMKRQKLMQNFQQQSRIMQMQQNAAAAAAAQQQHQQAGGANNNQQQRMGPGMPQPPQQQQRPVMPPTPTQQTPQMTMPTPTQQNKQQPTPRPAQQQPPASIKTPQQPAAAKNLKRPAPEEVIEITDNAQPAPLAPPMQATKSQQAGRGPMGGAAQNNHAASAMGGDASAQTQAITQRFGAILQEVKAQHKSRQPLQLTDEERQQLLAKVDEYRQVITRTEYSIRMFFQATRQEQQTKQFLGRYWHLADNVNPKEGTLLGMPTVRAQEFEALVQPLKQLVLSIWKAKMKEEGGAPPGAPGGAMQKPPGAGAQMPNAQMQQQPASGAVPGPQQLNAANLDQHNTNLRQQAAAQGHRRSSSKAQGVPQAPTAGPGQNPFDFNTPSPHGVPKYGEGAGTLTQDKLNIPPRSKKQKKDGQPPSTSSTPAQMPAASPHLGKAQSPQIKKQPAPEMVPQQMPQPPKNACRDSTCEYSRKGFNTPEELVAHMQQMHAPPADPLKFALETLAASVGLNSDGSIKVEQDSKTAAKTAPMIKQDTTTPAAGSTPLNKIPMKGSPAMDRLKTPQHHSSKPPPPTSAAPTADKNAKPEAVVKTDAPTDANGGDPMALDLLDFDPWKDAALQQTDLLEWLKPHDTFTGDWGNDRAFRSPQLTPATTPDTNVTDKTASTRDSEVLDGDGLNMTLALPNVGDALNAGTAGAVDFAVWKEIKGWEPGAMDPQIMDDLAAVGIDEGMVLRLDEGRDINDWEALFGPGSDIDGNKVPGWENVKNELIF